MVRHQIKHKVSTTILSSNNYRLFTTNESAATSEEVAEVDSKSKYVANKE